MIYTKVGFVRVVVIPKYKTVPVFVIKKQSSYCENKYRQIS